MRIAVWSPLPPAPSEVADHTADLLPRLAEYHEVVAVVEDPATVDPAAVKGIPVVGQQSFPETDLDVYQVGNSAACTFVYRTALERPGVVVLHDWGLHDLVWHAAEEGNDLFGYVREMRRSHGEAGSFVGHQVRRGRGGTLLPSLFAVNDRLLEASLGVATPTREAGTRLRHRHPRLPHLHLPQHLTLPESLPSPAEARRALGLPNDALLVTVPGRTRATSGLEVLMRAVGRLRGELPSLQLVVAGEVEADLPWEAWKAEMKLGDAIIIAGHLPPEDLMRHLIAADVVSTLCFPSRGGISSVLVRALGVGRPVLVTAGTPAAEEMPEGVVVPIDPGPREHEELVALLRRLLGSERLREEIGEVARAHALAHHQLETAVEHLSGFLVEVQQQRDALLQRRADRPAEGTLTAYLVDEVRQAARDLGLEADRLGLASLLSPLAAPRGPAGGGR